ncbi:MAG: hypothetical protein ACR2FM_00945 [Candidatus Saccharimonadales bacterium]
MTGNSTLYNETVRVCEEYLGPAGERFIRRQISTHLNIEPELLAKRNMPKLVNWSSIAFAMLTNDSQDVRAFSNDLLSLSSTKNG